MKICFAGESGHTGYVFSQTKGDLDFAAYAPGPAGEDVSSLGKRLETLNPKALYYNDYIKMLECEKPDILVVCSYFTQQAQVCVEALVRGINVFSEKPAATSLKDLERLEDAYNRSKGRFCAMYGIRYEPWFLAAKDILDRGILGDVRLIYAQKSYKLGVRQDHYKKRDLYGGTIGWVASHAIDWVHWLSREKFISVYAGHSSLYNRDHGDLEVSSLCSFTMTNEVLAVVSADFLRHEDAPRHDDDRLRIACSDGVLEIRDRTVYITGGEEKGLRTVDLTPYMNKSGIFTDFVNSIRNNDLCMVTAEESFYTARAAIYAGMSADEKRELKFGGE